MSASHDEITSVASAAAVAPVAPITVEEESAPAALATVASPTAALTVEEGPAPAAPTPIAAPVASLTVEAELSLASAAPSHMKDEAMHDIPITNTESDQPNVEQASAASSTMKDETMNDIPTIKKESDEPNVEEASAAQAIAKDEEMEDMSDIKTEKSDAADTKEAPALKSKPVIKTDWKERMKNRFFWRVEVPSRICYVSRPYQYVYSASVTPSEQKAWTPGQIWDITWWHDKNARDIWAWLNDVPEYCHRVLSKRKFDDYLENGQMNEVVHRMPEQRLPIDPKKPKGPGLMASLSFIESVCGRSFNQDRVFNATGKRFGFLEPISYMQWPAREVYGRKRANTF